jgi:hypothetical protein
MPEPEIDENRPVRAVQQDVRGLDVAVDEPLAVGVIDGLGHVGHQANGLAE